MPLTNAMPKALFPLVDRGEAIKGVLHVLLEEVTEAGIDDACIILSPGQKEIVRRYLDAARDSYGAALPSAITFIEQREPRGFGDAVLRARDYAAGEPFVLLLGDHIRISDRGSPSGISQVVEAFDRMTAKAMIGVHDVDEAVIHTMGVATGTLIESGVYRCTEFVEKPSRDTATQRLRTEGLPDGRYLAHCGVYIFDSNIFDCLEEEASQIVQSGKELELAAAQVRLLRKYPDSYYLCRIDGKAYDMGNPEGYLRAFEAMSGVEQHV